MHFFHFTRQLRNLTRSDQWSGTISTQRAGVFESDGGRRMEKDGRGGLNPEVLVLTLTDFGGFSFIEVLRVSLTGLGLG
jgi:hypothetical protein